MYKANVFLLCIFKLLSVSIILQRDVLVCVNLFNSSTFLKKIINFEAKYIRDEIEIREKIKRRTYLGLFHVDSVPVLFSYSRKNE